MTRQELDQSNATNILGSGKVDKMRHSAHNTHIADYVDSSVATRVPFEGLSDTVGQYATPLQTVDTLQNTFYTVDERPNSVIVTDGNPISLFYFDPSDDTSADDGVNVIVTVNGLRYKRISKTPYKTYTIDSAGNSLVDNELIGRVVYVSVLNDMTKNTGFTKPIDSGTFTFTDGSTVDVGQTLTLLLK